MFERRTYDMKCNWKTYVDNYLEGYHLPSAHPRLNRELDYNAYVVEPYARHVRQLSPIRGALLLDFSQLDAELLSRQRFAEHGVADRGGAVAGDF